MTFVFTAAQTSTFLAHEMGASGAIGLGGVAYALDASGNVSDVVIVNGGQPAYRIKLLDTYALTTLITDITLGPNTRAHVQIGTLVG